MKQRSILALVIMVALTASCRRAPVLELQEVFRADTRGWAHDVALDGSQLYVADRQGGFLVFDLSTDYQLAGAGLQVQDVISLAPNFGSPLLASRFEGLVLISRKGEISGCYSNGDIANAVEVRGEIAFAAYGTRGLVVTSLSGGRAELVAELPARGWSHDVRLSRAQALVADWTGLRIVDIANPADPLEMAFLPSPGQSISLAVQEIEGKRLVALAEGHAGIAVVELDEAGRPSVVGRNYLGLNPADQMHPQSGGWVHGVAWAGPYLFAANWKRGLTVLDAHDPRSPRVVLEYPTSGTSLAVKTRLQPDGSYLIFLADGESGLGVFRFVGDFD